MVRPQRERDARFAVGQKTRFGEIQPRVARAARALGAQRNSKGGSRRSLRSFIGSRVSDLVRISRFPRDWIRRGRKESISVTNEEERGCCAVGSGYQQGKRSGPGCKPAGGGRGAARAACSAWAAAWAGLLSCGGKRKPGGAARPRPLAHAEVRAVSYFFFFSVFFSKTFSKKNFKSN